MFSAQDLWWMVKNPHQPDIWRFSDLRDDVGGTGQLEGNPRSHADGAGLPGGSPGNSMYNEGGGIYIL